ncbi:MAG: STAS domain-containing protein [Candidatus Viridilinea halotolerans]|uniref:STAS domain-containing protein n=1 Tax=Candidatus Viridilinea halotolerans TaxID=2491704 RepID=A0A426UAT5_9CHLR|nr:MAG: STAS domain-containing protein [Candidatus Viridilinea halotolerans]
MRNLFVMHHCDEDLQRRGQNLIVVLWAGIALSLLTLPLVWLEGRYLSVFNALFALPLGLFLITLTKRGFVDAVAITAVLVIVVSLGIAPFASASFLTSAYFFPLTTLVAGYTLRPRGILLTLLLNLVTLGLVVWFLDATPPQVPSIAATTINAMALLVFGSIIAVLSAFTASRTIATIRQAREEAHQARDALTEANAHLEEQVALRTADLTHALTAIESHAQELEAHLTTQQQLNEVISQLALPLLPVRRDILVVPLVGTFDSRHMDLIEQRILKTIEKRVTRVLIFDVTGVACIDTLTAKILLQSATALHLMGTRSVLVGIRPEVAQTLVSLGIDLGDLTTYADLETALAGEGKSKKPFLT